MSCTMIFKTRFFVTLPAILTTGAILMAGAAPVRAEGMTGVEILRKVDEVAFARSSKGTARQIVTTAGGDKREFTFETYTLDGTDKGLSIYLSPSKVKGVKILTLNKGDDIWTYFPRTGRVRKIASSARKQKVMGSDFSYEDFAPGDFELDYKAALVGSESEAGDDCHKLELTPTEDGPSYSKLVCWVRKADFMPLRLDYYDDDKALLKRLVLTDIRVIQGHPTAMSLTMTNLQEGGNTAIVTDTIEYDLPLERELFSDRTLKQ